MTSYGNKKDTYIRELPKKRLLTFYLNILILTGIYTAFYAIIDPAKITLGEMITSFTFGETIISKGWYLQVILLFYILFYFAFRFLKKDSHAIALISVALLAYVVVCPLLGMPSFWYESVWAFVLGIVFARYRDKLQKILFSHHLMSFLASLAVFAISFVLAFILPWDILKIISKMVSSVSFCVLVLTVIKIIKVQNPIFRFLGKYSFEIYVFQGLAMQLWHNTYIYIENTLLYVALTVATILVISISMHPLFALIGKLIKNKKTA